MKADVCVNLACKAISFRPTGAPPPERCPRCDEAYLRVAPRTGRWGPVPRRRLVTVDGDAEAWS